jgi:hypothetical protein
MKVDTFAVGTVHEFKLLKAAGSFGVYKKNYRDGSGRTSYVVARLPSIRAWDEPPASALMEFQSESEALETFEKWRRDPLSVSVQPRRKKRLPDPAQTELKLEYPEERS